MIAVLSALGPLNIASTMCNTALTSNSIAYKESIQITLVGIDVFQTLQ